MVAELTGELPGLSPQLAEKQINRALREVYDARNWSFLVTDGVIVCPVQVTEGTIAYTQFETTVVCDADASAALLSQTLVGAVPGLKTLQIRLNPSTISPAVSQVYSILDFDATNPAAIELTLDRMIVESTDPSAGYQVYRAYVVPPLSDFKAWQAAVDVTNGWSLKRNFTSAYFDMMDPQRQAQGMAYYLGAWGGNRVVDAVTGGTSPQSTQNQSVPVYELWPHPTSGQNFYVRIRRRGEPLVEPTDELPDQITESLVLIKAKGWYAYSFAEANIAHYPEFAKTNWAQLRTSAKLEYERLLLDAKRNDNEQALQDVWNRGHGLRSRPPGFKGMQGFPIDAEFIQSHLLTI